MLIAADQSAKFNHLELVARLLKTVHELFGLLWVFSATRMRQKTAHLIGLNFPACTKRGDDGLVRKCSGKLRLKS